MNVEETQSEMENTTHLNKIFEQDEEYEEIMNVIRDAYSSI